MQEVFEPYPPFNTETRQQIPVAVTGRFMPSVIIKTFQVIPANVMRLISFAISRGYTTYLYKNEKRLLNPELAYRFALQAKSPLEETVKTLIPFGVNIMSVSHWGSVKNGLVTPESDLDIYVALKNKPSLELTLAIFDKTDIARRIQKVLHTPVQTVDFLFAAATYPLSDTPVHGVRIVITQKDVQVFTQKP